MNKADKIVQGALEISHQLALKYKHEEVGEIHFLLGLIRNPQSVASKHLQDEQTVLVGVLETLPTLDTISINQLKPNARLQEWFALGSSTAVQAGKDELTEADMLKHLEQFFPQIKLAVPEGTPEDGPPDFLVNLNELADAGKLDPVIGRSQEIRRVQEILCRRTKNNPVLVGMPGVGKTTIVEGLAGLIVANQVPEIIQGRTVYAMNMGSLVANTKYRGEFEEKIEGLLKFFKSQGRDAILFIDEIHLLIGAGKTDGAMDAANLLKPALSRGELNCIGATTSDEYKKYIESDTALERRFHLVQVNEPIKEDSIQILLGLKEKLEIHHGIEITEEAVLAAVYLSDQYIPDRFLPDKAIDIIDEAAAAMKLSAESMPPELQEIEALIRSKKILAQSPNSSPDLNNEIGVLEEKQALLKAEWDQKVLELKKAAMLKKALDEAQFALQKAEQEGIYEEASRIKYAEIPKLEQQIKACEVSWKLERNNVAEVLARVTGIPIEKILHSQQENMLVLEDHLNQQVFGQKPALKEISETLIAAHAGLADETRPLGSFLLLGPSGVGKTETSKALAEFLFSDSKKLTRIDLSEYRESHSVAKLIGAPPGYVGYEKGGILTEKIRRNPYSVILFDEIEKAHPDFSDILLQILDDARLTDTQGRTVDFKNTVIFVTSNLKDHESFLKPEIIGRFDAILHYQALDSQAISLLIDRELEKLNRKVQNRELKIDLSDELRRNIEELGFDERYGARPLKNVFNRKVIRPISKILLQRPDLHGLYTMRLNQEEPITA